MGKDKEQDTELGEIMEGIADDMGYKKKEKNSRNRISPDIKAHKITLILVGIAIVVILVLIALFSGSSDNKASKQDMDSMSVRLDRIEKKLANIESIKDKFARLEKQGERLEKSISRTERTGKAVSGRVDKLTRTVNQLQKKKTTSAVKAKTKGRKTFSYKVRPGDSLYRIANKYGMSVKVLCQLNHISKNKAIRPGQKLLVSGK